MANRIVLVSDDADFFNYMQSKLELRKSDELFLFSFDKALENLHYFQTALFIINSEKSEDKTLEFLKMLNGAPVIVMAYNEDDVFRRKCYRAGMLDFMSILTLDAEFRARLVPALSVATLLEKNKQYRNILNENNIIAKNNDVFLEYEKVLDRELEGIILEKKKAVFIAVSPSDQGKFLVQPNLLETIILNNIRKNDLLMNFAANKYFILLFDLDYKAAEQLWQKISSQFSQKIYAGIVSVSTQKRQQLINDALNRLHQQIHNDKYNTADIGINSLNKVGKADIQISNFKQFRQGFIKKIEQVITPVFYQMQQLYSDKLVGVSIEQSVNDGYGSFVIINNNYSATFNITSPGFSKVNIDVILDKNGTKIDTKRITLEPEELEQGLLTDLLEQFITEYKKGYTDENT